MFTETNLDLENRWRKLSTEKISHVLNYYTGAIGEFYSTFSHLPVGIILAKRDGTCIIKKKKKILLDWCMWICVVQCKLFLLNNDKYFVFVDEWWLHSYGCILSRKNLIHFLFSRNSRILLKSKVVVLRILCAMTKGWIYLIKIKH